MTRARNSDGLPGRFASGVTVVTTSPMQGAYGITRHDEFISVGAQADQLARTKASALGRSIDLRPFDDHFACTRTGNFLMPLMKLLRTLRTSPFNSIEASRGISSVNMSRISIRARALPKHTCGLPLPHVK